MGPDALVNVAEANTPRLGGQVGSRDVLRACLSFQVGIRAIQRCIQLLAQSGNRMYAP